MQGFNYLGYFISLILTVIIEIILLHAINTKTSKKLAVGHYFAYLVACLALWCICLLIQILVINFTDFNPLYVDYFVYVFIALSPVALFFVAVSSIAGINFTKKKIYNIVFIIPLLTIFIIWTNSIHGLFYEHYSINPDEAIFGPYFLVHVIYTYGLFAVDIFLLLRNSIKATGAFSKPSMLISLATIIPVVVNLVGMTIFKMNIYVTPISFLFTLILISIAIFKYDFLNVSSIALKKIVNQMSDLYLVLNKDLEIVDCNKSFETSFDLVKDDILGKSFKELSFSDQIVIKNKNIGNYLVHAQQNNKIYTVDAMLKDKSKYFNIEISGIFDKEQCIGILILIKDTTQHVLDMETLKQNQNTLMERERLASLGQMIGGIAHNLKTPIMSIAGAMEGLGDLIKEYDQSIDDPDVTKEDHHAIAKDMKEWVEKVNSYDTYMSDVITAVKGQSVNMNDDNSSIFTIKELLSRINILMKHELKNAFVSLNIVKKIDEDTKLIGNINSLVQVINNLISNAIQSYCGKPNNVIDLVVDKKGNNILISVIDHGCGIPKDVQEKLFTKMVTTKGAQRNRFRIIYVLLNNKRTLQRRLNIYIKSRNWNNIYNIITKKINKLRKEEKNEKIYAGNCHISIQNNGCR